MKKVKKTWLPLFLALALFVGSTLSGCSGGGSSGGKSVEKSFWSIQSYIDESNGAALDVIEAVELNVSGNTYQLTRTQKTTMDVWIDIIYYGSVFGTFTMTESGDEYVYTLSAPTRGIYANGQIEAVTTSIEPIYYDSDDQNSWPETLDGETAASKDSILQYVFATALELGDSVSGITVKVDKAGGQITSVEAGA